MLIYKHIKQLALLLIFIPLLEPQIRVVYNVAMCHIS